MQRAPLPRGYSDFLGRKLFLFLLTAQGLGAFALITLAVIVRKIRAKAVGAERVRDAPLPDATAEDKIEIIFQIFEAFL